MILYAVAINRKLSGDEEMVYLWRNKKAAQEYTIFLHAGEVVPMEVRRKEVTSRRRAKEGKG